MKLRTKLKIAFVIMAIMPVILGAIAIGIIVKIEMNRIRDIYGSTHDYKLSDLYSPSAILGGITDDVYEDLQMLAEKQPQQLTDTGYLTSLSNDLTSKLSYLVVREENKVIYSSAPYSETDLAELLPDGELAQKLGNAGVYKGGKYQAIVKAVRFAGRNGRYNEVYIVTPMRQIIPQFRNLITEVLLIIIGVLALTSFILYIWINRSIIRPIDRLRLGTQNIRDGNLDFEIKARSKDELGDLCRDFEEMRGRLNKSEQEKIKSDAEEKELIRNISHDLKTPLTAVKGYVEGLRDGIADTPEKQHRYVLTIANKVEDMDRLIDELTLFSRLDTNRIPYDFVKINVKSYFDDCVDEINLDLEAQNIKLGYAFHGDETMETMADPNQLKRVINNIVSNSVKYRQPGRDCEIGIEVFDEGDYIHVVMSDNGKGINYKDLPRIFDRFYRTDESRTSPQSGSGIGLAIVKKIVEDHKGRIWVESVEGEGTTFHLNLLRYREGMRLSLPDSQMNTRQGKRRKT